MQLYLRILGSVATVLAAWFDAETLKHYVFYNHRNLAYWTTGVALISGAVLILAKRKSEKLFRILFVAFLLTTAALVSITGYYGGKLVYEYGVGVEE